MLLEDVPHRQVVFTIPKRLRVFFRYDRKLLGELAGCAWRALKLYFTAYFDGAGVTPGVVGFVQTAGELLNFHPHIHVLVTDGGFLADGAFHPLAWFDSQHVERLFRAEVLRMLLDKELITEATIDNLLPWHHSGFSAHGAVRVEDRQGAVCLGRYMIRCPIVLKRLSWETETGEVVCRGRPSRRGGSDGAEARWDVLEFLARLVDHIREPSQQTVRYWGFYANAARGKRSKAALAGDTTPTSGRQDDDEFTRRSLAPMPSWARLIRHVYEVDPLLCPFCGAEMKILAFIVDFGAAKAIRKSLELPAQEPQPLAHSPPGTLELIAESA